MKNFRKPLAAVMLVFTVIMLTACAAATGEGSADDKNQQKNTLAQEHDTVTQPLQKASKES